MSPLFLPAPKGILRKPLPEPTRAHIQIAVVLPAPTHFMLQSEAACYGWRKSTFLAVLVMHKLGLGLRLERRPDAPRYAFRDSDYDESERWLWYLQPDLKRGFDWLRLQAGNLPPRAWIILAVNAWVGRPTGLDDRPAAAREPAWELEDLPPLDGEWPETAATTVPGRGGK